MTKLILQDLHLRGRRALVRVDFNVPLDETGAISDDTRIREALPTIRRILESGGCVVLISHLGRPKGEPNPTYSLKVVAERLRELLGIRVYFAGDSVGEETKKQARELKAGEILVVENLRFHSAEEKPELDPSFAKSLAELGELYVNDAFGTAHRSHASTVKIAEYFPGKAAAGLLMQKEIACLSKLVNDPQHPFYALIGGAKISSKIGVLRSLLTRVDRLFIGGAMAFAFLKTNGLAIGDSLLGEDALHLAEALQKTCAQAKIPLHLPEDLVVATALSEDTETRIIRAKEGIPPGWQGVDIGPATRRSWGAKLQDAATLFWNGPVGAFEIPSFAKGTQEIAQAIAKLSAITVVGGGDSLSAINQLGLSKKFYHLSTGGGASLEFLESGTLPGIEALSDRPLTS